MTDLKFDEIFSMNRLHANTEETLNIENMIDGLLDSVV